MKKRTKLKIGIAVALCALLTILQLFHAIEKRMSSTYNYVNTISSEAADLADGIGSVERLYQDPDNADMPVAYFRAYYDECMDMMWAYMDWDEIPLEDDFKSDIAARIEKLKQATASDEDFEAFFTDEENRKEIARLQSALNYIHETMCDFTEHYNQLLERGKWKKYFISWETERKLLSDRVETYIDSLS